MYSIPLLTLKVVSIKMDLAKRGINRKAFIKGRGVDILSQFCLTQSCESYLKIPRYFVHLLAN